MSGNGTGPAANGQGQATGKQRIVLIVDGRPLRQFYSSIFLQRLDYHVIMAKSAEDALLFIDLAVPQVVITDIDLPEASGLELLRQVRLTPRTAAVPFIIYTSNKDEGVRKACEEAGCAAYLHHPCTLEQLYTTVQAVTEERPRKFVRLNPFLAVTVGDGNGSGVPVRQDTITGISELGMFVNTAEPLAYGQVLPFAFTLPTAPGWLIRVEGQVVYNHLAGERNKRPGMGVKFLKVGEPERELIREFIRRELLAGVKQA